MPLTRSDLEAIRRVVREELERALGTSNRQLESEQAQELEWESEFKAWWERWDSVLAAEPDATRAGTSRALGYMRHDEHWRARARRFLGLPLGAMLTDEQMLAFARHHAEVCEQARVKGNVTRAVKRAARKKRDG